MSPAARRKPSLAHGPIKHRSIEWQCSRTPFQLHLQLLYLVVFVRVGQHIFCSRARDKYTRLSIDNWWSPCNEAREREAQAMILVPD